VFRIKRIVFRIKLEVVYTYWSSAGSLSLWIRRRSRRPPSPPHRGQSPAQSGASGLEPVA